MWAMHSKRPHGQAGFSLIEVLIAVVVLSVGLLALAQLQASVIRAGAAAKARSAASRFAQDQLEALKSFGGVESGQAPNVLNFTQLPSGTETLKEVGGASGYTFTRTWSVQPCKQTQTGPGAAMTVACGGTLTKDTADFLRASVTVSWVGAGDLTDTQSQQVVLEDVISKVSPLDSASAVNNTTPPRESPKVYITDARIAGTIPIAVGTDRSSASSDPQPAIIRENIARTQFDVLVFQNDATGKLAKRDFDYSIIGCSCKQAGVVSGGQSRAPTLWNGQVYTNPDVLVERTPPDPAIDDYVSVSGKRTATANLKSSDPDQIRELCTVCCRDHHDYVSSDPDIPAPKLNPARPASEYPSGLNGDHNHYNVALVSGHYTFTLANNVGDDYYETCRFVRRDGIYRLAQDTRLENVEVVREANLDSAAQLKYADYAKRFVDTYVEAIFDPAAIKVSVVPGADPARCSDPGNTTANKPYIDYPTAPPDPYCVAQKVKAGLTDTALLNLLDPASAYLIDSDGEQFVSRGIYIDYMNPDVLDALRCKRANDTTSADCVAFATSTKLELVPFYAINLTRLTDWSTANINIAKVPLKNPSDVFSRGYAIPGTNVGDTTLTSQTLLGNAGLTDPVPNNPLEQDAARNDVVPVHSDNSVLTPPAPHVVFNVRIDRNVPTGTNQDAVTPILISSHTSTINPTGCQATTSGQRITWTCDLDPALIPPPADPLNPNGDGTVTVSNYTGKERVCTGHGANQVCSTNLVDTHICLSPAVTPPPSESGSYTSNSEITGIRFNSVTNGATYNLDVLLQSTACP